jgi:competence protein ComEA
MADQGPLLGVSAASPTPASWPDAAPLAAPGAAPEPPAWPAAAQWCTAGLLAVFLGLLAWRGYGLSRYSTRPLLIDNEAPRDAIDLNKADAVDLRLVPGIGEKTAERILAYRKENGPFRSLDELRKVKGIGPATLERIRHYFRIDSYRQSSIAPPRVARGAAAERPRTPPPGEPEKGKKKPLARKVDVNTATAEQLRTLPGIGPTLSARILAARQKGRFRSVEELRKVKGIGAKTLQRLRPWVVVGKPGE